MPATRAAGTPAGVHPGMHPGVRPGVHPGLNEALDARLRPLQRGSGRRQQRGADVQDDEVINRVERPQRLLDAVDVADTGPAKLVTGREHVHAAFVFDHKAGQ